MENKEEWADVTPIEQFDGPSPVIPIAYTEEFKETMNYFRAVLQSNEASERAFNLTTAVIELNPANYTAWHYRRILLDKLSKDLEEEMEYTAQTAENNAKNYQVWHHRRCLVKKLNDASKELEFTALILDQDEDSKNYHAWAHRQWVITEYQLWDQELAFVERLLQEDLRNNSAWNHRFLVVSHSCDMESNEVRNNEIQYAINWINKAPNNQSPWNYIYGFVKNRKFSDFPIIKETCIAFQNKFPFCSHNDSMLVDIYEEENNLTEAIQACERLKEKDEIRKKYWDYRKALIESKLQPEQQQHSADSSS